MNRILLCHDGQELTQSACHILYQELYKSCKLDVLYVIPQNLIHYGQVDQLATPDSKQEFIDYVQQIGIDECKTKLNDFIIQINELITEHNLKLNVQMHVRWGNATEAIKEIITGFNDEIILIPSNVWGIDWKAQKNLAQVLKLKQQSLYII